ncbi:hypothetical protein QOM21_25040 [Streptomyces sp. Pv4-95]|uniref:hypothetical protein n=1 Tax=Streptomyces sp. Pv4-95 TaxID=3049543 RepID=UPI0038924CD4
MRPHRTRNRPRSTAATDYEAHGTDITDRASGRVPVDSDTFEVLGVLGVLGDKELLEFRPARVLFA